MNEPRITIHSAVAIDLGVDAVVVERKLSPFERLWASATIRKTCLVVVLGLVWQAYAIHVDNPLLFPSLSETLKSFMDHSIDGTLPLRVWSSMKILLIGYACGTALAAVMTVLAINTQIGTDLLETLTAMFNPLPAIALLPLALIWFGLGSGSVVFVLIHSVMWAVALNTHSGFLAVSQTLRMVGRNYGLRGIGYVMRILVPAAFPSILTGLKIGWAFAWRTLIAAELVFGTTSGQGGLGWYIFEAKNQLDIPEVFAGLLSIVVIGLFIENVVFRVIEMKTVRRWGMQS